MKMMNNYTVGKAKRDTAPEVWAFEKVVYVKIHAIGLEIKERYRMKQRVACAWATKQAEPFLFALNFLAPPFSGRRRWKR